MPPGVMALAYSYNYGLVALSALIAIFASYAALDLAGRVTAAHGWSRAIWLAGGATAMGLGIWSMHYIGMLAFKLPVPVFYDWPTVLESLLAAILASAVALYVVSRQRMGLWQAIIGSIIMGSGIAAMHYIGMAAMRLAAICQFDTSLVILSIVLATVISLVALWLAFRVREEKYNRVLRKLASATLMGVAIPVMHYTGMAAAAFTASSVAPDLSHAVSISALGTAGITIVTMMVLALVILTSHLDRRYSAQGLDLASAEQRYRLLFERSLARVIQTADGLVLDCNDACAKIFGYTSREELLGSPMGERYLTPADHSTMVDKLKKEKTITYELRMRRKDGSPVWVLGNASLIDGDEGAPATSEETMIDVTEQKHMEVKLFHAQKLEAVGGLAAGMAHEINTPIQFVGDNARFLQDSFHEIADLIDRYEELCEEANQGAVRKELLERARTAREKADWAYLRTEVPKALEQMLDGVGRVATIVRAMKEFSHVDQSVEKTAADLNKALESTLVVAWNELKYVAEVETNYGELPLVMCHLGDLNQVFLNLLVNAAHAIGDGVTGTGEKGRIGVRTKQEGEWVEIAISDTGTGVPERIRERIFDPFFTTKEVGKGSGQGLALARAIVMEKHGGTLTFETEVGKGTTFYVRLPVNGAREAKEMVAR